MTESIRPVAIEAIDHAGAAVEDIDAAIEWWQTYFGFELEFRLDVSDIGATLAFMRFGDQRVEFISLPNTTRSDRDVFGALEMAGVHHIALRVANCAQVASELEERGVELLTEPTESPTAIYAFLRDGSGNFVELIQPKQADGD